MSLTDWRPSFDDVTDELSSRYTGGIQPEDEAKVSRRIDSVQARVRAALDRDPADVLLNPGDPLDLTSWAGFARNLTALGVAMWLENGAVPETLDSAGGIGEFLRRRYQEDLATLTTAVNGVVLA